MIIFDTSQGITESPYMALERWAKECQWDLLNVPPATWQASVFIHRRRLALYSASSTSSAARRSGVGGGAFDFERLNA